MKPHLTTIMPEVIDCIAQGKQPTDGELVRVADHIWSDVRGSRSAFAWGELSIDSSDRLLTLRAAHAALSGDSRPNRPTSGKESKGRA